MALYDYFCKDCGTVYEVSHGMEEKYNELCAACGCGLHRLYTSPGLKFVGVGFHANDYGDFDQLNHQKKDEYEKRQAEQYDINEESKDENYKQNIRDISGQ